VPSSAATRRRSRVAGRQPGDPRGEQLLQAAGRAAAPTVAAPPPSAANRSAPRASSSRGQRIALRHAQHPAPDQGIQSGEPRGYQLGGRRVVPAASARIPGSPARSKIAVRAGPAGDQEPRPRGRPAAWPRSSARRRWPGLSRAGHPRSAAAGAARRRAPQEDQHGVAHQQPVRRRSGTGPQGHSQARPGGRRRARRRPPSTGEQELVEPGEADLPLELSPGHAQHHGSPAAAADLGPGRSAAPSCPCRDPRTGRALRRPAQPGGRTPAGTRGSRIPADQPASGLPSHLPALLIRWASAEPAYG